MTENETCGDDADHFQNVLNQADGQEVHFLDDGGHGWVVRREDGTEVARFTEAIEAYVFCGLRNEAFGRTARADFIAEAAP